MTQKPDLNSPTWLINQPIWDKTTRYMQLADVSAHALALLKTQVANAPFRQGFHVQPACGLMNDPNGFCYYQGAYHLFYQWFPLGPVHGLKHWYHVKSTDLVNWTDCGVALIPNEPIHSHGAYSGSGFVHDDVLYLFYTANRRNEAWERSCSQVIAKLSAHGMIETVKDAIPAIPDDYTEHFRDPKVWSENGMFYAIIGAQRQVDHLGTCVLYQSENGLDWSLLGELKTHLTNFGYMWECPDYFMLPTGDSSKAIMIFSPQGITSDGMRYNNIYQSGYLIGDPIDLDTLEFHHDAFKELDFGFDFYAPQTTLTPDGKRILIAWMGLPEIAYPSDKDGWAHCMTIPRELTLSEGKLRQTPVASMCKLRQALRFDSTVNQPTLIAAHNRYELILATQTHFSHFKLSLFAKLADSIDNLYRPTEAVFISYDARSQIITIDRSQTKYPFAAEYGYQRQYQLDTALTHIQIFADTSSIELFLNQGEAVATLRHFSSKEADQIIWQGSDAKIQLWCYD